MKLDNVTIGRRKSPVGELLLAWRGETLVSLDYEDYAERFERLLTRRGCSDGPAGAIPNWLASALDAYFAGDLAAVDQVSVSYFGTEFENRVWDSLRSIHPGRTATYGQMAALLEVPKAARAVGRANSMNPVAIVVPCHRVVGANAKLTGYAGGLDRKRWLLDHERRHAGMRA